jgi:CubicO group peptidase (beta-lactamase class C family)
MQDFSVADGRYVFDPVSIHPAYPFNMTARDLARFGQLILNGGRWDGAQIVPADWVRESTTSYSQTDGRALRGYGYMWWVLPPEQWGPGAAVASGSGSQHIAIIPAKRLVAIQINHAAGQGDSPRGRYFFDMVRKICAAIPE